jgi:O-antigen/teichoic acid export membrane protein
MPVATTVERVGGPAPDSASLAREVRTVARGGTLTIGGFVASAMLQSLLVLVVTRGVGAGGAGVFFEAVSLFTILSNWGQLGADVGCVREVARLRALGRIADATRSVAVALVPVAAGATLAAAVVYVYAPAISSVFFDAAHRDAGAHVTRLIAFFVPLAAVTTVSLGASRGFGTMKPYVLVQNIALPTARIVLVFAVVAAGLGTAAVALAWTSPLIAACAVALACLAWGLRKGRADDAHPRVAPRPLPVLASSFWRFSAPRAAAAGFGTTVTWLDVLLVGAYTSASDAAVYAAASRLSLVGTYALYAAGMALAPQFSSLIAQGRRDVVDALYQTATAWLIALGWPLYATLAVLAPVFMSIFGPHYNAGATALTILALAGLVNFATGNVTLLLLMAGGSGWNMFNAAASLATNVALNLVLIPRYGIEGAAIAWAASIVLQNALALAQVRLALGFHPFARAYVVAFAALAAFGGIGLGLRAWLGASPTALAVTLAIATPLYALFLRRARSTLRLGMLRSAFRRGADTPRAGEDMEWITRILTRAGRPTPLAASLGRRLPHPNASRRVSYAVLPNTRRPRLLIPLASREAAAKAFERYRSSKLTVRAGMRLAKGALRAGLPPRALPNHLTIAAPLDETPLDQLLLEERLQELLDRRPLVASIVFSPGRPQKKPVLQICTQRGEIVAYAKVGWNELTRRLVRTEAAALARVAAAKPQAFAAPGVFAAERWNELELLVVEPLPLGARGALLDELPLEATAEVARVADGAKTPLAATAFWRAVRAACQTGDAVDARLEDLAFEIEGLFGEAATPTGFAHGDWVPWNMARAATLLVWDWERAADGVPVGLDAVQFLFQTELNLARRPPAEAVERTLERAAAVLPAFGLERHAARMLCYCHVLEALVRLEAGRSAAIRGVISSDRYWRAIEALARTRAGAGGA